MKTSHTTGADARTASSDGLDPAPTSDVRHFDHPPPVVLVVVVHNLRRLDRSDQTADRVLRGLKHQL
ncbi:hypothetical protein [Streptomyces sp. NRRL S-378]|uniref:hypothetical protein n=1 Tax=Streptomyces sp. NRRL S-378 TaxID=1463904 RepID=UPI0004C648BA|nr:hypothetical protein [Streptomyces sp. NRRL S-378]